MLSLPPESQQRCRSASAGCATTGRPGGFSLIELVIALLITSILAAAAVPAFLDSLLFHRVESAARRLQADLELARQTARLTSAAQSVSFTSGGYSFSDAKDLDNPAEPYAVDLTASPYELDSLTANFSGAQIISFDGYATPSSGGTVVLSAKDHRCTVTLDGTSGAVTITSNHARARTAQVVE